ncbi:hypothetical protein HDU96_000229 [Phlyctochytrium bullatum]|nr:hypothetical protein HDU96_000229 [Phlyctochytrium bullatum]
MKFSILVFAAAAALLAPVDARFGQEQAVQLGQKLSASGCFSGDPTGGFGGQEIQNLLAGADPCAKIQQADALLARAGDCNGNAAAFKRVLDAAMDLVAAERNFNPFAGNLDTVCTNPELPRDERLRGITQLVDPRTAPPNNGDAAVNAAAAKANDATRRILDDAKAAGKGPAAKAKGRSIADQLVALGFTAMKGVNAGANKGAGNNNAGKQAPPPPPPPPAGKNAPPPADKQAPPPPPPAAKGEANNGEGNNNNNNQGAQAGNQGNAAKAKALIQQALDLLKSEGGAAAAPAPAPAPAPEPAPAPAPAAKAGAAKGAANGAAKKGQAKKGQAKKNVNKGQAKKNVNKGQQNKGQQNKGQQNKGAGKAAPPPAAKGGAAPAGGCASQGVRRMTFTVQGSESRFGIEGQQVALNPAIVVQQICDRAQGQCQQLCRDEGAKLVASGVRGFSGAPDAARAATNEAAANAFNAALGL